MKKRVFLATIALVCLCTVVLRAQKVACVGDSITYGSGISNRLTDSYPAQLGAMLLQYSGQWEVRNFGVSGATLLRNGNLPYVQQSAYSQALQWQPDIVIIMLGTNDSKPPNWVYSGQFVADYCGLIDSFATLASQPNIWICRPVPVFRPMGGITNEVIRNEIDPLIDQVAHQREVRFVDLYTPLLDASDNFPDGVHPNPKGARLMAQALFPLLFETRSVPEFNRDGVINLFEYAVLAQLYTPNTTVPDDRDPNRAYPDDRYDLAPPPDGDGLIGLSDFAGLFQHWLKMPGLLAHWSFDETAGNVAQDGLARTPGTVHGDALWQPTAGQKGGALAFDGVDDYVETGYVLNPASGPFTVIVWAQGGQPGEVLVSQAAGATWIGTDPTTGKLMTKIVDNAGRRVRPPLVSDFIMVDGLWHEIVLVWDGSYRHLLVDNVEVAVDLTPLNNLVSNFGRGLYIGAGQTLEANSFWTGRIDDVRIYNEALRLPKE